MLFAPDAGRSNLDDLLAEVAMVSPGFVHSEQVYRGSTAMVLHGTRYGESVTVKALTSSAPQWRDQFVREIEVYRYFAAHRPPVRVPRLLEADERRLVLVTERIFGNSVDRARHPSVYPGRDVLASLFTQLRGLHSWRPAVPRMWRMNYGARVERARRQELVSQVEYQALRSALERAHLHAEETGWEFGHGDVELSNVLLVGQELAFVDWGAAGLFLPGFDLALLWMLLGDVPGPRRVIDDVVGEGPAAARESFLVNVALLVIHELRVHQTSRPSPERDARLRRLRGDWAEIRGRLVTAS